MLPGTNRSANAAMAIKSGDSAIRARHSAMTSGTVIRRRSHHGGNLSNVSPGQEVGLRLVRRRLVFFCSCRRENAAMCSQNGGEVGRGGFVGELDVFRDRLE